MTTREHPYRYSGRSGVREEGLGMRQRDCVIVTFSMMTFRVCPCGSVRRYLKAKAAENFEVETTVRRSKLRESTLEELSERRPSLSEGAHLRM